MDLSTSLSPSPSSDYNPALLGPMLDSPICYAPIPNFGPLREFGDSVDFDDFLNYDEHIFSNAEIDALLSNKGPTLAKTTSSLAMSATNTCKTDPQETCKIEEISKETMVEIATSWEERAESISKNFNFKTVEKAKPHTDRNIKNAAQILHQLKNTRNSTDFVFYTWKHGAKDVGIAKIVLEDTNRLEISQICINPDSLISSSESGIGTTLINEIIKLARFAKIPQVVLYPQPNTERFYEKLGFYTNEDLEDEGLVAIDTSISTDHPSDGGAAEAAEAAGGGARASKYQPETISSSSKRLR